MKHSRVYAEAIRFKHVQTHTNNIDYGKVSIAKNGRKFDQRSNALSEKKAKLPVILYESLLDRYFVMYKNKTPIRT